MCRPTLSPLETVETTFRLLATGPQPLALNGHTIGLRRDSIGLWDLRGLLFHPAHRCGCAAGRAGRTGRAGAPTSRCLDVITERRA